MDKFIEKIPSSLFSKVIPEITKEGDNCVKKLYSMLLVAQQKGNHIEHNIVIDSNRESVNNYVKGSLKNYNSGSVYYFPISIIEKISNFTKKIVHLYLNTGNRIINISFLMDTTTFNNFMGSARWNTYLSHLKTWFAFLDDISPSACAKKLNITIYMSNEKKELPVNKREMIGVVHVNGAFSDVCQKEGEIVIYRKEEWFKVLIHESLHNYGIDFSLMDQKKMGIYLFQVFPIGANIEDPLFSETYTETWAELLNVGFMALELSDSKNTFSLYFHFLTQVELFHSLAQTQKILYHYDLSYESLVERNAAREYQQASHVFEYYILKTVLLSNYGEFLCWADKNMRDMIFFPNEERKMMELCEFIKDKVSDNFLTRALIFQECWIMDLSSKDLRMTICEF